MKQARVFIIFFDNIGIKLNQFLNARSHISLNDKEKVGLGTTIFKPAETVHLILFCQSGDDAITCAVLANLKMVARNRPLNKASLAIIYDC